MAYINLDNPNVIVDIADMSKHMNNTEIHVSNQEKETWNNKSNFDGDYNKLVNKPIIPTKLSQLNNDSGFITDVSDKANVIHTHSTNDINDFQVNVNTIVESVITEKSGVSIATLNANGLIPLNQLPPEAKEIKVVNTIADRDTLTVFEGLSCYVLDATGDSQVVSGGALYINNGLDWLIVSNASDLTAVLDWSNITNKPQSSTLSIDETVINSHYHGNKPLLDTYTESNADIQKAIVDSHIHTNASSLDKLNVTARNTLQIDGVDVINDNLTETNSTYSSFKIESLKANTDKELYKIKATSIDDSPAYLESKIDNITISLESNKLVVKNIQGLQIGVVDMNTWLSGTSENIQNQINRINYTLSSISTGMNYLGKVETYAELLSINNKENGTLVVVLSDESRDGGRTMYVYRESLGLWDFIGLFDFADDFTSLTDTPNDYVGADGKVLKVDELSNKIVFANVDYNELTNKPNSVITEIDDAVEKKHRHSNLSLLETYTQTEANIADAVSKKHNHSNKVSLDKLDVNANGELTINGIVYNPVKEKKILQAHANNDMSIGAGTTFLFGSVKDNTINYDATTGFFEVEKGKTYHIVCNALIDSPKGINFYLIDTTTDAVPTECYGASQGGSGVSNGSFSVVFKALSTRNLKIRTSLTESNSGTLKKWFSHLSVHEL